MARGKPRVLRRSVALPHAQLTALRALMSRAMGPLRHGVDLRAALAACSEWAESGWQARVAEVLLAAALSRTHSLGAHCRMDAIPA